MEEPMKYLVPITFRTSKTTKRLVEKEAKRLGYKRSAYIDVILSIHARELAQDAKNGKEATHGRKPII